MANMLVIGGAGGLGSEVVAKLIARGDTVSVSVLNDTEEAAVRATAPAVANLYRLDLADADDLKTKLSAALTGRDGLDALIVCAAISPYGPLETTSLGLLRRTFEINTVANVAVFQAALPALRANRGRLVLTSSMAGLVAMPFIGAYAASKFALEAAADVMRREAAPQGVDVVLVEPGGIKTAMVSDQLASLVGSIDALSEKEYVRYGYLYRAFQVLADRSHHVDASTPGQIAEVVLQALDAHKPLARYLAGADARQLVELARNSDDAALDAMFDDMFRQAAAR